MALAKVKLNYAEVGRILRGDMRGPIDELASKIAESVRSLGIKVGDRDGGASEYDLPVTVRSYMSTYKTGRAAAAVSIAHPAGLAVEAKHGALRKAAASLGLEVKSKE